MTPQRRFDVESLDDFETTLDRISDVESVNRIYPAGEDIPGLVQAEIRFYSPTVHHDPMNESNVFYRGLSDGASDLMLTLGPVVDDGRDRDDVKADMEAVIDGVTTDRDPAGAGVVVNDLDRSILGAIRDMTPLGSELQSEFQGINVTVVTHGTWDAEDLLRLIDTAQRGFTEEVLNP